MVDNLSNMSLGQIRKHFEWVKKSGMKFDSSEKGVEYLLLVIKANDDSTKLINGALGLKKDGGMSECIKANVLINLLTNYMKGQHVDVNSTKSEVTALYFDIIEFFEKR